MKRSAELKDALERAASAGLDLAQEIAAQTEDEAAATALAWLASQDLL